jgi:hypothetical protein
MKLISITSSSPYSCLWHDQWHNLGQWQLKLIWALRLQGRMGTLHFAAEIPSPNLSTAIQFQSLLTHY